jgi:CDP-diacylglycerol pyrophosphatase
MARAPVITAFRASAAVMTVWGMFTWLVVAAPPQISPRDALWIIVHDVCVTDQLQNHNPQPCTKVDLDEGTELGFAILKDIRGATQFLLIPTTRISGIESPILLAPGAPNYFAAAWEARKYIDEALHRTLPRDDIGLAINSAASRSQDQLHIHVDCIRRELRDALRERGSSIGNQWMPLNTFFSGHRYEAIWVAGERLGSNNPFRLLAHGFPDSAHDMGDWTLVVVGSSRLNGAAGFILLADRVNREGHDSAHGEDLLDHACHIATPQQPEN